jgi:pimeloyl-ACP methyl ester carboxylesterase
MTMRNTVSLSLLWTRRLGVLSLGVGLLTVAICGKVGAATTPNGEIAGLEAKFVDVEGIRARYYDMGEGEPLVLLHGSGMAGVSTANNWSKNIPELSKQFRVIALDRLGVGLTGNPLRDEDYGFEGEVKFLYDFVQTMELGKIHIAGNSYGAAVSFLFAVAHPDMVKTLILVGPGPHEPPMGPTKESGCPNNPPFEAAKCRSMANVVKPDEAYEEDYFDAAKYMFELPKAVEARVKDDAGVGRREDLAAWLQAQRDRVQNDGVLQMPILVYRAKQDRSDWLASDPAPKMQKAIAMFEILGAKNPNVQMIIMNNARHFMYRDRPELFNQDVINFITYWNQHPADTSTSLSRASQ